MSDPASAAKILQRHFSGTSDADFVERAKKYCPELTASSSEIQSKGGEGMGDLVLLQPQRAPLRLNAYLACALTGLVSEQRQLMFHISDIVSTICLEQDIDLYEPRKQTDPVHHPDVLDAEVFRIDRERVLTSDLVVHLCHYPSTGAGEELDFAYTALVPLILVSHGEHRVSRMITGIPSFKLHLIYTEPEDLRHQLRDALIEVRPVLEQRKLAFSKYDVNIVGDKIRSLREEWGLTRADVAYSAKHMTAEMLKLLEESTDRVSNPSLIQLREIAYILKTTVASLVEPDLNEQLMATLQSWVSDRAAARFGDNMTAKDRNRIVRRVLLRVIDSLEE
jgi:hypothetical protein